MTHPIWLLRWHQKWNNFCRRIKTTAAYSEPQAVANLEGILVMSQGHFPFAIDRFVTKQDAIKLTSPFWTEVTQVWALAWKEWGKIDERHRAILHETPHVPAVNIWSFAQHFAKELFLARDGIVICDELPGLFAFYIQDKLLVRFNALSPKYVVQNCFGASERREEYFNQEDIDGLNNSATRITVGSIANPTRTDAEVVAVSCQKGEYLLYSFRVDGGDEGVLPLPGWSAAPKPKFDSGKQAAQRPR